MHVLEIGCGAGRVTRALGGHFGQIYAVDISPEMVRQARRGLADFPNVRVFRNNGRDLSVVGGSWWNRWGIGRKLQLDFAFSCIVFQHIPNREIIENYVREVNRLLRPGGLFKFQVQGNPASKPMPMIPGWAIRSPRARPAKWPPAADSRCATTTALAANITGSGFLSSKRAR